MENKQIGTGVLDIPECVFCNYKIRQCNTTPRKQLTRRDLASITFNGKDVCGSCHDDLSEFLESE
jgi:hypothetical protein